MAVPWAAAVGLILVGRVLDIGYEIEKNKL